MFSFDAGNVSFGVSFENIIDSSVTFLWLDVLDSVSKNLVLKAEWMFGVFELSFLGVILGGTLSNRDLGFIILISGYFDGGTAPL